MHASQQLAATIGGALAAKPLLERLLGPSFDYVGHSMAALLERFGNQNLMGIFKRTAAKLADVPKPVDARVLRAVIEDGSFADDAAAQEYFAGLLAASMANDVDEVFMLGWSPHRPAMAHGASSSPASSVGPHWRPCA